jgi:hypothetical protein
MNRHIRITTISCILLLLLAASVNGPIAGAQDQDPPNETSVLPQSAVAGGFWTAVGSTGTVDEASQPLILHETGLVRMKPNLVGSAIIRYNVVGVDGLLPEGNTQKITLLSHFYDNGAGAQVVARLYRVSHGPPYGVAQIMAIDSNPDPAAVGWQSKGLTSGCLPDFAFGNYAYVVEVSLKQTSSAGVAALSTLRLQATACP